MNVRACVLGGCFGSFPQLSARIAASFFYKYTFLPELHNSNMIIGRTRVFKQTSRSMTIPTHIIYGHRRKPLSFVHPKVFETSHRLIDAVGVMVNKGRE